MKRGPRIEVPNAQGDELPLRSLIATSVACVALGLAAAYGLADRTAASATVTEPTDAAPTASAGAEEAAPELMAEPLPPPPPPAPPAAEIAAAIAAPDAGAAVVAALEPPAAATSATDAAVSSEPVAEPPAIEAAPAAPEVVADAADATAPPQTPQPPADARHLKVKPGVIAYLRCEGVPQKRGKYPCPRDRALEARLREIIEELPKCRDAVAIPRTRSFEVRLELGEGGTFKELQVKGPNEAAERAVRTCAGPGLRKARTELKTTRMIVSMRFKAR